MDYLPLDDGGLIVFDPEAGDTHFLDSIGLDIVNAAEDPKSLDELVQILSESYLSDVSVLEHDVKEFLQDLLDKRVFLRL